MATKIITTSGGGMLVTEDEALAQTGTFLATQAREAAPHYEHSTVGYNYRLSNLLAAVGRGNCKCLMNALLHGALSSSDTSMRSVRCRGSSLCLSHRRIAQLVG